MVTGTVARPLRVGPWMLVVFSLVCPDCASCPFLRPWTGAWDSFWPSPTASVPAREILVHRKGRGQAGGGYYEKALKNVSHKPCSSVQFYSKQHGALGFVMSHFRAQCYRHTYATQMNFPGLSLRRAGFCWNECAYSVESNLQSISSNSSLWKRTKWSVAIQTWSWCGKPAASRSARAGLREANAER